MEIDVRADRRLRGSAAAQAAVGPLVEALCRSDADLARTRVVCDWIQYRNNFRDTAMVRPVLPATQVAATPTAPREPAVDGYDLAVDLRRCARPGADVAAEVTEALADVSPAAAGIGGLGGD